MKKNKEIIYKGYLIKKELVEDFNYEDGERITKKEYEVYKKNKFFLNILIIVFVTSIGYTLGEWVGGAIFLGVGMIFITVLHGWKKYNKDAETSYSTLRKAKNYIDYIEK